MLKGGKKPKQTKHQSSALLANAMGTSILCASHGKPAVTFPHNIFALLLQGMISCVEKPTEKQ